MNIPTTILLIILTIMPKLVLSCSIQGDTKSIIITKGTPVQGSHSVHLLDFDVIQ